MPYTVQSQANAGLIDPQSAALISRNISAALERYHDEKKKAQVNDGVFQAMGGADSKYIDPKVLERWDKLNEDQRAGAISVGLHNMQSDQQLHDAIARQDAAIAARRSYSTAGNGAGGPGYVPDEDTLAQMDADGYTWAPSGGKLGGKWIKQEGEYPQPGTPINGPDGQPVAIYGEKGRTIKIGAPDPFKAKMAEMMGGGPAKPAPAAAGNAAANNSTALPTPEAAQAPAAAAAPAPAGNLPQPGEVRRGYRYKGGNPSDPNSWEKVQ